MFYALSELCYKVDKMAGVYACLCDVLVMEKRRKGENG